MIETLNLSDNFADKLVEMILSSEKTPFEIAQIQIILPTKRACRTVKEAFVKHCENKALLLPKLTALYELEVLEEDIEPAISSMERLILLTRLCQLKPNIDTLYKALMVATGLTALLDEFYQFEASLNDLEKLVPNAEFAQHWNETITFLDIIRNAWPALLKERGQIDEMHRKIRLIDAFTKKIQKNPPENQIIMAGFDGAIPAVLRLTKELNKLNNSLILLNGFNNELTDEDLKYIGQNHYQYAFKRLIHFLHLSPQDIRLISKQNEPQEELITEAFKPAEQTDEWRYLALQKDVLQKIKRIDCDNLNEEALTIALILREVLETPEKTAALVTNDRMLARRVILEMKRWNVELDDSAGTPLHHTPVGVFLSLIANAGKEIFNGTTLISLLKHPLAADTVFPTELRNRVKNAEKIARKNHTPLLLELNTDINPFKELFASPKYVPFEILLKEHLKLAEKLATSSDRSGIERLWSNEAGQAAYTFLTELSAYASILGDILPSSYPDIFTFLISSISVRSKYGMHPQLDILGPIEARLTHPDVCIISGLNEGSFPLLPDAGPWLSRPMRQTIGLPSLEAKITTQEMDFAHCFCSPEVYLTRSLKMDGSPTIPSRFLSRIEAVLQASNIEWDIEYPQLARLLDKPTLFEKIERPSPKPPVAVRPKTLSVTNVELLMRNPYAIYAKYILNLYPLDNLEEIEERQIYGSAIHSSFETFLKETPFSDDLSSLADLICQNLKKAGMQEASIAFYQTKVEKIAAFLIAEQQKRKETIFKSLIENKGEITFFLSDKTPFKLTGKADRIDILTDDCIEIIDYKTGSLPTFTDIENGYSPQMPLEAVIAQKNGFSEIINPDKINLSYWKLTGKKSGGEITSVPSVSKKMETAVLLENSFDGMRRILEEFNQEARAYEASPHPEKVKFNNYEQLSREKEWLNADDSETGE